jgi:hypothetical protein
MVFYVAHSSTIDPTSTSSLSLVGRLRRRSHGSNLVCLYVSLFKLRKMTYCSRGSGSFLKHKVTWINFFHQASEHSGNDLMDVMQSLIQKGQKTLFW